MYQRNDPGSSGLPHPNQNCEVNMSHQEHQLAKAMNHNQLLALRGMRLPAITLRGLRTAGIYCQSSVSIEHQHLAKRYVLRGVESGGAVADLGAYCSFVNENGEPISWLQRVDSIAVNGVHAIVVAPVLLRVQMIRVRHTYDLLISKHALMAVTGAKRPTIQSSIVFYGRRGTLEMDLCGKDSRFSGTVRPLFFGRSGEPVEIPSMLEESILRVTSAVSCVGCRHSHLLQPATTENLSVASLEANEVC
jgi:hypothetical protein